MSLKHWFFGSLAAGLILSGGVLSYAAAPAAEEVHADVWRQFSRVSRRVPPYLSAARPAVSGLPVP